MILCMILLAMHSMGDLANDSLVVITEKVPNIYDKYNFLNIYSNWYFQVSYMPKQKQLLYCFIGDLSLSCIKIRANLHINTTVALL